MGLYLGLGGKIIMYEYCPRCDCKDIRKISQHCGYATFRCEDCGYTFDIDDC